jgi:arylsulfatase A-like enzyme
MEFYDRKAAESNTAELMNCNTLPHPVYDEQSSGKFFADEAIKFIINNKDNPFFLWLAFFEPHHPYYFPIEYSGKYRAEDMPLPKGSPEDDRWVPEKFRDLSDDEKRGIIASYYTSTEYMDKNIGLVIDAINEIGISDNTLIVYLSDNGYLLNDHKRFEKHTMWEESVNQPMIFRFGNGFGRSEVRNALVEYIDVVPTIIDLLGMNAIEECQGNSFKSVLLGEDHFKNYVFSEYLEDNLAMVRSEKWKYMFTSGRRDLGIGYKTGYGPSGIVHRLYNLSDDPNEMRSLAEIPAYTDTLILLKNEMLKIFMQTHPHADECPKDLTLDGKLAWFCEPRDIGSDQSETDNPFRYFYK